MNNSSLSNGSMELNYQDQLQIVFLRHIIYGWLCLPISLVGIFLNCFSIYVLIQPKMKSISTNMYLTALSVSNIVVLINYIIFYSLRYLISYKNFNNIIRSQSKTHVITELNNVAINYENFCNIILWAWSPIFLTIQLFSIYLTCAITIDRSIYVLLPFKKDVYCSKRRTLIAIYTIFFGSMIINLPRWFEVTFVRHQEKSNVTYFRAQKTHFGQNKLVQSILHKYTYNLCVYIIPFCILLVFNSLIIHKLAKRAAIKRRLLNGCLTSELEKLSKLTNDRKDSKVTFMVIAVVVLFFSCQFPYLIVTILSVKYDSSKYFHLFKTCCDLLSILNSCVNFGVYAFFGETFRQLAKEILFKKAKKTIENQKF